MKAAKTGTISGCIVWVIVFGLLCTCFMPVAMIAGNITSTITQE